MECGVWFLDWDELRLMNQKSITVILGRGGRERQNKTLELEVLEVSSITVLQ